MVDCQIYFLNFATGGFKECFADKGLDVEDLVVCGFCFPEEGFEEDGLVDGEV